MAFIIQLIYQRPKSRRKKLRYVRGDSDNFTSRMNEAHIFNNSYSTVEQYCAHYNERYPQHKFSILAVNIVIDKNFNPYA
jgi:hypothetical protein